MLRTSLIRYFEELKVSESGYAGGCLFSAPLSASGEGVGGEVGARDNPTPTPPHFGGEGRTTAY